MSAKFSLDPGGRKRLVATWKGAYTNFSLTLDGKTILTVADRSSLIAGRTVLLPDGSQLTVQILNKAGDDLRISRNGRPLPGSVGDPETALRDAALFIYFIAVVNVILGLVAEVGDVESLKDMGIGASSLLSGAIYALLGIFVRRRSLLALAIAIVLYFVDGIVGAIVFAQNEGRPNTSMFIVRVFLSVLLFRGWPAIRELNKIERLETAGTSEAGG